MAPIVSSRSDEAPPPLQQAEPPPVEPHAEEFGTVEAGGAVEVGPGAVLL